MPESNVPGDAGYNIDKFKVTENLVDKYRTILKTPEKTMYQRIEDLERRVKTLEEAAKEDKQIADNMRAYWIESSSGAER